MRTDHLIAAIVTDAPMRKPSARQRARQLVPVALGLVAVAFFALLGIRPDLTSAAVWPPVLVKLVATTLLAGLGLRLALVLAQPGRHGGGFRAALLCVPAVLLLGLLGELVYEGVGGWQQRLVGQNQLRCLVMIPLLSLLPLLALLVALRQGAVTRPLLAGLVCGLAATGMGATFYSLYCTDDSLLFVSTWYPLAGAIMAALGGLAGRLLLRW